MYASSPLLFKDVLRLARDIVSQPGVVISRELYKSLVPKELIREDESYLASVLTLEQMLSLRIVNIKVLAQLAIKIGRAKRIRYQPLSGVALADPIYAYVQKRDDDVVVVYNADYDIYWRRFAIIKELLQVISGTCERGTSDAHDLIQHAMRSRELEIEEGMPLDDETVGLVLALEVCFPWLLRGQYLKLRERGVWSIRHIAIAFLMPEPITGEFVGDISDEQTYAGKSHKVNSDLDANA